MGIFGYGVRNHNYRIPYAHGKQYFENQEGRYFKMTETEHKVGNYLVYVDTNGFVTSGIKDIFGDGTDIRSVYPYRWSNNLKCWIRDECITLSALRAGIKRETIALK